MPQPLKRHDSLVPLSRFHRSALFLALVLKKNAPEIKGYPTSLEGKRDYAQTFYQNKLKPHFDLEEKLLLPVVCGKSPELERLSGEVELDHRNLHHLFNGLAETDNLEEHLHEIGVLLESHIRKEERQFFQLIQNELTEEELSKLKLL